jgi:hypothetical protein
MGNLSVRDFYTSRAVGTDSQTKIKLKNKRREVAEPPVQEIRTRIRSLKEEHSRVILAFWYEIHSKKHIE